MSPSRVLFAVLLVACKGSDPTVPATTEPSTPPTETDPPIEDTCGDGELDAEEDCDHGDENGPDANCFEDCTVNPSQHVVVRASEVVGPARLDAEGVADATAPEGEGAWTPSTTDLGGDGLVKFELNIPLYDFYPDLTPQQLALVDQAPYAPPESWLGPVLLGEIAEIAFHTNTPAAEGDSPYFLVLYTRPDAGDTTWYGHRLTALPTTARSVDAPNDTWVRWSVHGPSNQFSFADEPTIGTFTAPGLPALAELGASFDWSSVDATFPATSIDYQAEEMRFVSIQTSSGNDTVQTDARVDRIEIELVDGRSLTVDLEP